MVEDWMKIGIEIKFKRFGGSNTTVTDENYTC